MNAIETAYEGAEQPEPTFHAYRETSPKVRTHAEDTGAKPWSNIDSTRARLCLQDQFKFGLVYRTRNARAVAACRQQRLAAPPNGRSRGSNGRRLPSILGKRSPTHCPRDQPWYHGMRRRRLLCTHYAFRTLTGLTLRFSSLRRPRAF